MSEDRNITSALYSIPPEDRETWWQMGAALKSHYGEDGFALWDAWSRQSDRYKAVDAKSVWRSLKAGGGIGLGSLFHTARQFGWSGDDTVAPAAPEERKRRAAQAKREANQQVQRWAEAARRAESMMMAATLETHPYLEAKGFPAENGLTLDGNLLIPMRNRRNYTVQSIQMIDAQGGKKFLPGGKAGEAVYKMLGEGIERWYCEGYATGLSVCQALRHLYRQKQSEVWVCFSAANLPKVVKQGWPGYVIADHDASGTGERYAQQTGLPWWMPPDVDTDANDFMLSHGTDGLADALREVLRG